MRIAGIELGRRRLGGLLCAIAPLLGACGETSQSPSAPAQAGQAGQAGGGGSSAGSAGAEGGGAPGQSDNCPKLQPARGSACTTGQRCFYPGSVNPCAPPDATYTCTSGSWDVQYGTQNGTFCQMDACSEVNPGTGCPYSAPAQGASCSQCSPLASCQYGELAAKCQAGLWQVTGNGNGGAAGAGNAGGAAGGAGAP